MTTTTTSDRQRSSAPAATTVCSSKQLYSWQLPFTTKTVILSTVLGLLVSLNLQPFFPHPTLTLNDFSSSESYILHPLDFDEQEQDEDYDLNSQSETIRRRVRDLQDESIRSWGCGRNATPLIFVHIGKAGGGYVRRRIAAAALNVTRSAEHWNKGHVDQHYYPTHRQYQAKFCSSGRHRHLPVVTRSFELYSQRCTATTPLGHILACPEIFSQQCLPYDPSDEATAHLVYAGHNFLGTELHWLPIPYLQEWWRNHWGAALAMDDNNDPVISKLETLDGIHPWCQQLSRPLHLDQDQEYYNEYWDCAQQYLELEADDLAQETLRQTFGSDILELPQHRGRAYGQIHASLPVTRVTILREPISWLLSKWSWHKLGSDMYNVVMPCDDIDLATRIVHEHMDGADKYDKDHVHALHNETRPGWVRIMSLQYILYLCGEDCYTRWERLSTTTLEELEAQAAYNLRNSFAVVGLLHQQDAFFEMLHKRVQYMDLHLDHAEIFGYGKHASRKNYYCHERFQSEQFQQALVAASPELQALIRLYAIGVQVNSFQMRELEKCSGRTLSVVENQHRQR